ncbi:hypothetical protein GCM10010398_16900 [Streptomyces fimbriatus]
MLRGRRQPQNAQPAAAPQHRRSVATPARPGSRRLVTGASGMLGRELTARLCRRGVPVLPLGRADPDVTDPAAALSRRRPACPSSTTSTAGRPGPVISPTGSSRSAPRPCGAPRRRVSTTP